MSEWTPAADPAAQARYQVRFDVGLLGVGRIAQAADVLVWADQVSTDAAGSASTDGAPGSIPAEALAAAPDAVVVVAALHDAAAVAAWILAEQEHLGRRAYVAIVAAGRTDGGFAADDVLAAGAVVDALTTLGIDDTSPEAAVAASAFAGLRRAVAHLATASVSGREAVSTGADPAALRRDAIGDASAAVRVIRPR
ncbi:2-phosphosulfolactate phosphatase [Agromyces sp. NPDC056523]|uniref:2-phosphosulfolactate phosphatase n=1 Tax=Agromyces sp. NPDC056523 TaxID=3345850 RepID=UPI00366C04BE